MGFIDSYKRLDKLCGDMFNNDRGISAYIDEMLYTPNGSYYVRSWGEDFKKLKHYRWVRNQISHKPGYTEQNMCDPDDELWLDEFYSRIMEQTDPLALYHRATRPKPVIKASPKPTALVQPKPAQKAATEPIRTTAPPKRPTINKNQKVSLGTLVLLSLLGIALALFVVIGALMVFEIIHILFQ